MGDSQTEPNECVKSSSSPVQEGPQEPITTPTIAFFGGAFSGRSSGKIKLTITKANIKMPYGLTKKATRSKKNNKKYLGQ